MASPLSICLTIATALFLAEIVVEPLDEISSEFAYRIKPFQIHNHPDKSEHRCCLWLGSFCLTILDQ